MTLTVINISIHGPKLRGASFGLVHQPRMKAAEDGGIIEIGLKETKHTVSSDKVGEA